jgi:hypothetical protein
MATKTATAKKKTTPAKKKPAAKLKAVPNNGERPISRQALWQRKQREKGLCVLCSQPAFKGWRCAKHYATHKELMRLRYIPTKRGRYKVGADKKETLTDVATASAKASKAKVDAKHRAKKAVKKAPVKKKAAVKKK